MMSKNNICLYALFKSVTSVTKTGKPYCRNGLTW